MVKISARVLAFTALGVAPLFLVSVGFPFMQDAYGIRRDQLGVAVSTYFVVAALSTVVLRKRIDRVGVERGLRIAALMTAGATVLAAVVIRGPATLVLALACAGAANAMAQISANVALATRVTLRRQALAFGIKQSAIPVASLLISVVTPWLAGTAGWQVPFLATAVVAAAAAAVGPRLVRARRPEPVAGGSAPPRPPPGPGARRRSMSAGRTLALLATANGLGSAAGNATAVFAVDAGLTVAGLTVTTASLLLGISSAASVAVRVGAGWLVDRLGGDPVPVLRGLFASGVLALLALALAGRSPVVFGLGLGVALGAGWGFPGLAHYASTRLTDLPPGASTGWVMVAGYLGPVLLPTVVGVIAERASYQMAWALLAGLVAIATACVALLPTGLATRSGAGDQR